MNRIEAADFFDKEVKGRFPDWTPTKVLIEDWLSWILPFDYDIARQAIKQHRFNTSFKSPVLKEFYAIAKNAKESRQAGKVKEQPQPILAYRLRRSDGVEYKFYIASPKEKPSPEIITNWAEKMAVRHAKMYSKNVVIIRDWEINF